MSANLERLGRDLIEYGNPEAGQRLIEESKNPIYPHSVEEAKTRYFLEHPGAVFYESFLRLSRGQTAETISDSGIAADLTPKEEADEKHSNRVGLSNRGDFKSKEGSVISVWNGHDKDLYLIIQNVGDDGELKKATKTGFLDRTWGIAIRGNAQWPDKFGQAVEIGIYNDKNSKRRWAYGFDAILESLTPLVKISSKKQRFLDKLADVLVNKVIASDRYQELTVKPTVSNPQTA